MDAEVEYEEQIDTYREENLAKGDVCNRGAIMFLRVSCPRG